VLEVFFDEVRTVSEEDLKALWAHLLSEELEAPGPVPRQVIQILKYMDLPDARAFTSLCNFAVTLICEGEGDKVFLPRHRLVKDR
jgi:hypothetical protein